MTTPSVVKSAILAVVLVLIFFASWEMYLRHKGFSPDYDDGPELWSYTRAMADGPADKTTVFIGSSRIKYDLDIPEWQHLTGTQAVQLAMTGSSPLPILSNLADDPQFKGRLVIDVTEVLFFTHFGDTKPTAGVAYYKQRTPAQQASFKLGLPLEANFVFLNSGRFAINALLGELHVPDRPETMPFLDFPASFQYTYLNRQNHMTPDFLADSNQINKVKGIWGMLGQMDRKAPPASAGALDSTFMRVKSDVDKIRARGGQVIFTRTPSSGAVGFGEQKGFPRNVFWDRLLAVTGCAGIHYADYPQTAGMQCPEWSHLSPQDAVVYTKALVAALETKGWKF